MERRELVGVLRRRASDHATYSTAVPRERDEPVRLTKIYTRGGDAGETSLGDGSRVSKLDERIAAFGTVDEVNSLIGVVLAGECPASVRDVLLRVQNELFDLGADLSVPLSEEGRLRVSEGQVEALERRLRPVQRGPPGASRASSSPGAARPPPGSTSCALHVAAPSVTRWRRRVPTTSTRSPSAT